ncbi:MAG: hypothetical protein ACK4WK_09195, partial [Anaerolineae bacterium]
GEADEIFQGRQPCLTVVDGRSFLVVNLAPAESCDATTWGLTWLELQERGIRFHDIACDEGRGLRAGVREAEWAIPLCPDLFHLLRDAHRLTQRLERAAYRAIETAERARRAEQEAQGLIRRRGRPLKVQAPLPEAVAAETQAIARFDAWCWLLGEIRQALEPISSGRLVSVTQSRATLETAVALLRELGHPEITAFADDLEENIPQLLAPLAWLEQHLRPVLQGLEEKEQAFILWAWEYRQQLGLNITEDIPEDLQVAVRAAWEVLGWFHRSSSLAESLHSWLRPYLQIHRGMTRWLIPLLQLFWNHHAFERGKRAGHTPLELAGVENAPSLAEVLGLLVCPGRVVQPA